MSGVRNRLRSLALLVAAGVSLLACEHGFFAEPAADMASLALDLSLAAGGPAAAFDKADNVYVRVLSGGTVRFETSVPIAAGGSDIPVAVEVPLTANTETFTVSVEIRLGSAPLFRGSSSVELGTGPPVALEMTLQPVGAGFVLPATFPTVTAWGDTVNAAGAIVFVTGDTVGMGPVTWVSSLDPAVVAISGGVPVARSDGTARLVGGSGTFLDTMTVTVLAAVQSITVAPDAGPLPVGGTRQFTSSAFDRRGNRLTRTATWSSSDGTILTINATSGLGTGVRVGQARAIATIGTVSGNLLVTVSSPVPVITNTQATSVTNVTAALTATVQTNNLATEVWFEYATNQALTGAQRTASINLPASTNPATAQSSLSQLTANTVYYARAVARSSAGTSNGAVISFTTERNTLTVVTLGAARVCSAGALISGEVTTGDDPVIAYMEWSDRSDFFPDSFGGSSSPQPIAAQTGPVPLSVFAEIYPGGPTFYYFRAVAQTSRQEFVYGATMTFDARGACSNPQPVAPK